MLIENVTDKLRFSNLVSIPDRSELENRSLSVYATDVLFI